MIAALRQCVICREYFAAGRTSKGLLCGAYECRAEWSRRHGGRRRADGTARPAPPPAQPRAVRPKAYEFVGPQAPTAFTITWPPRPECIAPQEPAPAPPAVEKPIRTTLRPQLAALWKENHENAA